MTFNRFDQVRTVANTEQLWHRHTHALRRCAARARRAQRHQYLARPYIAQPKL